MEDFRTRERGREASRIHMFVTMKHGTRFTERTKVYSLYPHNSTPLEVDQDDRLRHGERGIAEGCGMDPPGRGMSFGTYDSNTYQHLKERVLRASLMDRGPSPLEGGLSLAT